MTRFARFSKPDWGGPVFVNPLAVRYLRPEKTTRGTMVVFDKEQLVSVAEDIETVAKELDLAIEFQGGHRPHAKDPTPG